MTDFRALCAELVEELAAETSLYPGHERGIVTRARAALAQPEPEGPTDEELLSNDQLRDAWNDQAHAANSWDELGIDDVIWWTQRQALARWGRPAPQPVPGEEQELVSSLRSQRANYLESLQRLSPPQPVPVSERLPGPGVKVLAHYLNGLGKGRTICAIWVPAKSRADDDNLDNDDFLEYDEEDDKFYWPEGWYETIENWDDLGSVKVHEGEIIYWQPLPQWPAHALPLPSKEVDGGKA